MVDNSLFAGSNITKVKTHNLQAILMSLLYEGELSRADIAKRTSLSSATITNLTAELIKGDIIAETDPEAAEDDGIRGVGRPKQMLQLVPNARYAVGVHIGVGLFRVALINLHADLINNSILHFEIESPSRDVLQKIAAEIDSLVAKSGIDQRLILGVGVGASGLVNHDAGINVMAPRLGWQNVNIQQILESQLPYPVRVDNNVRTMAIGEAFFGVGRDVNVLAFVYGRSGVGAGFVVNRQVFRGSGAGAGEIGHMNMIPDGGQPCRCGQHGCLETLITEPVIIQKARELASQAPDGILAQHLNGSAEGAEIDRLFNAARAGDQALLQMLQTQIRYLGIALANLVNTLNPEMILLGGVFAQGDEFIRPVACEVMKEAAFSNLGDDVIVKPTSFGWRAGVVGAGALALMDFFYQTGEGC